MNSTNNTVDPMEIYKVIITARNNVEGARNGTSVEIRGVINIRILKFYLNCLSFLFFQRHSPH